MLKHVVCYKLADCNQEALEECKRVLTSMVGIVPEIRSLEVGFDALGSPRSYDMILIVVLDDFDALKTYQSNEYHVTVVKKHMHSVVEKSVSVDFEF